VLTSEQAKELQKRVKNFSGRGRPKREKEETVYKLLDAQMPIADVLAKLAEEVKKRDLTAIKTWLAYRWGQPIEMIRHEGDVGLTVKTIVMLPPKVDPG